MTDPSTRDPGALVERDDVDQLASDLQTLVRDMDNHCGPRPEGGCRVCESPIRAASLLTTQAAEITRLQGELEEAGKENERLRPRPSKYEHLASVVYRTGPLTPADYDEAIQDLQNARTAVVDGDSMGCRVCEDSGHSAAHCHHNPLLLARKWAAASRFWQCWHCGYVATNDAEGREHFGDHDGEPPTCIKAELIARAEAAEARAAAAEEERDRLQSELADLRAKVGEVATVAQAVLYAYRNNPNGCVGDRNWFRLEQALSRLPVTAGEPASQSGGK